MKKVAKAQKQIADKFLRSLFTRCFKDTERDTFKGDIHSVNEWFSATSNKFESMKSTSIPLQFIKFLLADVLTEEGLSLLSELKTPSDVRSSALFEEINPESVDDNVSVALVYKGRNFFEDTNPNTVGIVHRIKHHLDDDGNSVSNVVFGALSQGQVKSEYRFTSLCALFKVETRYIKQ